MTLILIYFSIILTACVSKQEHHSADLKPRDTALKPIEINETSADELNNMMEWAKKGMVKDCPFNTLNSLMGKVKSEWGDPDKIDKAGYGFYADYNNKKVVFGYNKFGEIFDIRSYDENLKKVTSKMIVEAFGQPAEIKDNVDENIYVYQLSQETQLKTIIPKNSNTIDHISVFNPKRASDYTLEIKGVSNKLSNSTWASMQKWRNEIVLFSNTQEHVYINGPNQKKVALTFDDGPDDIITPSIIDILADYHVKGNFFFLGSEVKKHPDVVKNAYNHGNLILSHSYNHVQLPKLNQEAVRKEIADSGEAIQFVIGKKPAILRTPYGDTNALVAETAKEEGYSIVLWSIDTLDWAHDDSSKIISNVLDNLRNGDIILMHTDSDQNETKEALPRLIEELQKRNFEIVDLEDLLNTMAYQ